MMTEEQERNYRYFSEHLQEFLSDPLKKNKYGVFFDERLQQTADTFPLALEYACAHCSLGGFIIQQISEPERKVEFLARAVN